MWRHFQPAALRFVTGVNTQSLSYDFNGNRTYRLTASQADVTTYDAENRLTEVKHNGVSIASFVYDGDGARVKGVVNGVTTIYVGNYYEVSGGVQRKYYYAGNQRVAMRENTNAPLWLLGDHLGSTAYTANGTAEQGEVRYKPFGATRYSSGSTPTTYRYTGQREEASLGLYDYGARWYDPALGRFIQADTIIPNPIDAQSFDRYAYVNNNPLKYNDPTGHCATLQDGSPDLTNDAGCWQAAKEFRATFGWGDDEGLAFFASTSNTEEVLRASLYAYWHPIFQQSGQYHSVYNPPPQMNQGPPPPSLVESYKQAYLTPLLACAKAVSGACGVKGTGAAVGPGFGGQVGVNFYVDQSEAIGLYGVAGMGPAVALEGIAAGTSVAMEIIPNGNVFDIEGWGMELEASASYGKGVGIEVAGNIGLDGSGVLSLSPQATTGFGAQAHWFITYAYPIYQSK